MNRFWICGDGGYGTSSSHIIEPIYALYSIEDFLGFVT